MNEEIRQLEPQEIWNHFADLNAVPRASKKEEQVIAFIKEFGKKLGLTTEEDAVGNVLIRKPASPGMENKKTVILQSHLDMVHQKNENVKFDFSTQGIEMFVEEDWVKARGTTLGADNGLGVATMMAILSSKDIKHPPIEALFTIDEETGMTGAQGLQGGWLTGDYLLNLDTEEDNEIGVGCAGGIDITITKTYEKVSTLKKQRGVEVIVRGLNGGHSGMDIDKGLGNANKIMNRLLYGVADNYGAHIHWLEGGGLRNAIPRESSAILAIDNDQLDSFLEHIQELGAIIKKELIVMEPNLDIGVGEVDLPDHVMKTEDQRQLTNAIYAAPNGVYTMSASITDLVETSNNIARVSIEDGKIEILCLTRSSVETAKQDLVNAIRSGFENIGATVETSGAYPGWAPDMDSEILKILETTYNDLYPDEPDIAACHAGLECGILGQNYPGMEMISFGPTIRGAHSPDERASIKSVQKFWQFIQEILARIPEKD